MIPPTEVDSDVSERQTGLAAVSKRCEGEFDRETERDELAEVKYEMTTATTLDMTARARFEERNSDLSASIDALTRDMVATKKRITGNSFWQASGRVASAQLSAEQP